MVDILTSLHGNRVGLDKDNNLVFKGRGIVPENAIETGSTAAAFNAMGATRFGAATAKTYTLGDTPIGSQKILRCTQGSTSALQTVNSGSTAITFDGTKRNLKFNAADDAVILLRETATRYSIISNVGSVAVST